MGTSSRRSSATRCVVVRTIDSTGSLPYQRLNGAHSIPVLYVHFNQHRKQYIDEREIWVYAINILEGLAALHSKGVVHRGASRELSS